MTAGACVCDDGILMNGRWWSLTPGTYKFAIQLCAWVARHSPFGAVSWNTIKELAGSARRAKRLIAELVGAGAPVADHGILVQNADSESWTVCDSPFRAREQQLADATPTKRTEQARQAGLKSAEARRQRTGSAQPGFSGSEPRSGTHRVARPVSNDRSNDRSNETPRRSNEPVRTPSHTLPQTEKIPAAATAKDQTGSAHERRSEAAAAAPATPDKVSCPEELELTDTQVKQLRDAGVPDYAIRQGKTNFLLGATSQEPRTLAAWQLSMARAIQGNWNDPKKRPKSPDSFDRPGPSKTGKGAGPEYAEYTLEDGRKVIGRY